MARPVPAQAMPRTLGGVKARPGVSWPPAQPAAAVFDRARPADDRQLFFFVFKIT